MSTFSINISQAEIEQLNYERFAYPQPMVQKRILSVYLKGAFNYSNQSIGLIADLHPNTVSYWIGVTRSQVIKDCLPIIMDQCSELEVHSESILSSFSQQPRSMQQMPQNVSGK